MYEETTNFNICGGEFYFGVHARLRNNSVGLKEDRIKINSDIEKKDTELDRHLKSYVTVTS